jgi:plasmid segregation protein ParM
MSILGIDIGYGYVKTSPTGVIFKSQITEEEPILPHNKTLQYNGKTYYIGIGRDCVDVCRINDELLIVLMIYAVLSSTNDQVVNVVTGLPIAQMKEQAANLRSKILSECGSVQCVCDGRKRFLSIHDCAVYPQGLASVFDSSGSVIVVDIGTRTVNLCYVLSQDGRRRVEYADTLYEGMLPLYEKIKAAINQKYSLTLTTDLIPSILSSGLFIEAEEISLSFIIPIIKNHVAKIADQIKIHTPHQILPMKLVGGGSLILSSYFKKIFPKAEVYDTAQFANSTGFLRRGEVLWQRTGTEI